MNIAIILVQSFDPNAGGVQRVTANLSLAFNGNQINVEIVVLGRLTSSSVTEYNSIPIKYIDNLKGLGKTIIKNRYDVIINQKGYSKSLTKAILKNKSKHTKLVNNLHINPLNFYANHKLLISSYLERKHLGFLKNRIVFKSILAYHIIKQNIELSYIIRNVDAFVMLSTNFIPELFRLVPGVSKYKHKIYGIGNPFEQPGINLSDIKKENIILFVGRLNKLQKRVDLLVEIWKSLHHQFPDWRFWVVGDGEDRAYMEKFCQSNSLNRVQFFGKDKPDDYYKKAKIFHMTSAFEGFGNVLVEAQSYGCVPVLFNSYSAASDIVNHEENGLLVGPFKIDDYVLATSQLIMNPTKLNNLSLNAVESVRRFSFEKTYSKWQKVFNRIIESSNA